MNLDDIKVFLASGGSISSFYMHIGEIVQITIGILTIAYIVLRIKKLLGEK
jgi:hypothetical protein